MKSYLVKTPKLVQRSYPKRLWAFPHVKDTVYLTFDDGPIPKVTPWVLELLAEHNAKATFFCIGENITKHPVIFERIIDEGHSIGNHTYNHLNGRQTTTSEYVGNVELSRIEMNKWISGSEKPSFSIENHQSLFRPPYGRLTSDQARFLQNKNYKIVMWDVLSYDFDSSVSEEKCLQNITSNLESGSIVVFHDSLKAEKNLRYALPKVLNFIAENNWKCRAID